LSIDLNADVGEGMDDAALMPFVTSANVACGLHAGDATVMDGTVSLALANGVRVGAHPGYPDRQHFGRLPVEMPADDVENLVLYQVAALDGFVRSRGGTLTHVKPHGALYHCGAEFPDVARAIAEGVRRFRPSLVLVGAAASMLIEAGRDAGLAVAEEAFADRRYLPDGSTVPRGDARALITDPDEAAEQSVGCGRTVVATTARSKSAPIRSASTETLPAWSRSRRIQTDSSRRHPIAPSTGRGPPWKASSFRRAERGAKRPTSPRLPARRTESPGRSSARPAGVAEIGTSIVGKGLAIFEQEFNKGPLGKGTGGDGRRGSGRRRPAPSRSFLPPSLAALANVALGIPIAMIPTPWKPPAPPTWWKSLAGIKPPSFLPPASCAGRRSDSRSLRRTLTRGGPPT
jgi:UPF0271 protein